MRMPASLLPQPAQSGFKWRPPPSRPAPAHRERNAPLPVLESLPYLSKDQGGFSYMSRHTLGHLYKNLVTEHIADM